MDLIQKLKDQVKPLGKKIVLPEYKDERVLKATEIILKEGFVTPVLVGNPAEIAEAAKAVGVSVEGAEIIDPANYDRYQEMVDTFVELRAKKGMTPEKADATMKGDCLFFGAMLVRLGAVDVATHAVIRERLLEKSFCHDLSSQNNDTSAWCGSAHKNGNS